MSSQVALEINNLSANAGGNTKGVFDSWVGKSHREEYGNLLQYSCLENHGQRSLAGYRPLGHKELNMTEVTERMNAHRRNTIECLELNG